MRAMVIDGLLTRLECVRKTGDGQWLARCPSHPDRTPSLSIRETPDGTVLVYCFGGCAPAEIVAAAGLTLADLFPEPLPARGPIRRGMRRISAIDALITIDHEALITAVIAADLRRHREIDEATWSRLATAAARIGAAREAIR